MTSHFARLGTSNTPKLKYCDGQERSYCNLTISIVDCQSIQIPNPTPQHPACIQTDPNKPIYIPTLSKYNTYLSKPTPTSTPTRPTASNYYLRLPDHTTRPWWLLRPSSSSTPPGAPPPWPARRWFEHPSLHPVRCRQQHDGWARITHQVRFYMLLSYIS